LGSVLAQGLVSRLTDKTVNNPSQDNWMLCDAYDVFRSTESPTNGPNSVSTVATGVSSQLTAPLLSPSHVHNELLCFMHRICSVLAFDNLVSVCADFYQLKDVEKAKNLLSDYVPEKRLTKHQGSSEHEKILKRR